MPRLTGHKAPAKSTSERTIERGQTKGLLFFPESSAKVSDQLETVFSRKRIALDDVTSAASLKHIWEMDTFFKCPVIGGSLSIEEHRRVLNKAGYPTKRKRPYHLHRAIMDHLNGKNPISVKVDNYLRHKYRNEILALKHLDEDTFMEKWRECLGKGEVNPIFYVAAARKGMSTEALGEIFGDAHMMHHASLHEISRTRHELSIQWDTNRKLARLLKQQKERTNRFKREIPSLKSSLTEARFLAE